MQMLSARQVSECMNAAQEQYQVDTLWLIFEAFQWSSDNIFGTACYYRWKKKAYEWETKHQFMQLQLSGFPWRKKFKFQKPVRKDYRF